MINENFILVGVAIQFLTAVGYVIDTIKGKVKPNRVSWFLWMLAPGIAFFAEIKQGVGLQSLLTFIVAFVPLMVLTSSFVNKKSYWKLSTLDFICGAFSLAGLILWLVTKTGNIAIIFSILADMMASIPTVVKAYKEPESEGALVFWAGVILGGLTILTINNWTIAVAAYPIYILIMNLVIASFVSFKFGKILRK